MNKKIFADLDQQQEEERHIEERNDTMFYQECIINFLKRIPCSRTSISPQGKLILFNYKNEPTIHIHKNESNCRELLEKFTKEDLLDCNILNILKEQDNVSTRRSNSYFINEEDKSLPRCYFESPYIVWHIAENSDLCYIQEKSSPWRIFKGRKEKIITREEAYEILHAFKIIQDKLDII